MSENAEKGQEELEAKLMSVFFPVANKKVSKAKKDTMRFVHYTSAETAMRIFQNKEVWMRKSTCMNDFMEIEHGRDCLVSAYQNNKDRIKTVLENIFPNFCENLEKQFDPWVPHFASDTYIACISEHGDEQTGDEEDKIGRLSMWRAYGGNSGVAIVMNGKPFQGRSESLKAYSSPVAYMDRSTFEKSFLELLDGFEAEAEFLKSLGEEYVLNSVFQAFRFAMLSTKHPGFREEREWRIIYNPTFEKSDILIPGIESIGGTPQPIVKIPLKDIPDQKLEGIEIPTLVERVIIGPTQYPSAISEALVRLLEAAGMKDAGNKVVISDIPLRRAL